MSEQAQFDPTQVHIWEINDIEWWIGAGTREDIRAAVIDTYGDVFEDDDEYPQVLSDAAIDSLNYYYGDEEQVDKTLIRTFREQLAIEVADGLDAPRMFACEDW